MATLLARALLALILTATGALTAQNEAQGPQRPAGLTATALDARITAVKEQAGLDEAIRTAAVANYTAAVEAARTGDGAAGKASGFDASKQAAPQRTAAVRTELGQLGQAPPPPVPPAAATLEELERLADKANQDASKATADVTTAEQAISDRAERHPTLPQLITAAKERAATVDAELEKQPEPPKTEPDQSAHVLLLAQQYAARQEVAALEAELGYYDGGDELLTVTRDLASQKAARATQLANQWRQIVASRREADAQAAQRTAEQEAAAAQNEQRHPLIVALATQNQELAGKRSKIASELTQLNARITATQEQTRELGEDFEDVSRRIRAVGLTDAMGALLRDRRSSLPSSDPTRQEIIERRDRLSELQLQKFDIDRQFRIASAPERLAALLATAEPPIARRTDNAAAVAQLLETRVETLNVLRTDGSKLFDAIVRLDSTDQQLLAKVEEYSAFVNERVLWIRSTTPIWKPQVQEFAQATRWITSPDNWASTVRALAADVGHDPVTWSLAVAALLALILLQRRIRGALKAAGERAERSSTVSFTPTSIAVSLTLLASLPLPALFFLFGWRLSLAGQGEFAHAAGLALIDVGWMVGALTLFRHVIRRQGLAESHFQWSPAALTFFRRSLRWVMPLAAFAVFAISLAAYGGNVSWRSSISRPTLMVLLAPMTWHFWKMLHPRTGLVGTAQPDAPEWARRFRRVWFVLGTGIPASLFVLSTLGYHFTARQLAFRFALTIAWIVLLYLIHDLVLRSLMLARRRLAMAQAAERRKAAAAAKAEEGEAAAVPVEEQLIDAHSVAEQTRSLVRSLLTFTAAIGAWWIWVDVLPALGILRSITLWEKITLAEALLAALVFAMTFLAARNLPGVLELTVLQRLEMHAGERHAITTIARYVVVLIGCLIGFSTLGLEWSKLQWLAAGISVGLGFGLQEVFANFVSGLIILFERPIRIGDLVTVNGIDGYVTRIRMRATTIRDYNRKELIIPNREFITGSVVNWTLSDAVTRLIVKVGVAYGSDTEATRRILLEVAESTPGIVDTPKPKALFLSFGDSTLDFELRAFTTDTDARLEVIDRVNREVDRRFRDADIEIAFPQRDLHIRSAEPLVEALRGDRPADKSDSA